MNTFEHACSIKKFLSVLTNNNQSKEFITTNFNKLECILTNPECKFTNQLRINQNLIEVLDGWWLSLSQKTFVLTVKNPIKEIGKECPRAFVQYFHAKGPEAKHLQEILENTSSPTGVTQVLLRILLASFKSRN